MEAKLEEELQEQQKEESVTPQYVRARRRVVAYIPDVILVLLVAAILGGVPSLYKVPRIVWVSLYFVFFWAWRGQTPGKMLLGIKIVRQDGSPPGFIRVLVRYTVGFCGLIAFFVFSGLGVRSHTGDIVAVVAFVIMVLSVSFDRQKRGIHDKLAGTYVIRLRRKAPQEIEEEGEDEPKAEAEEESPPPVEEKAAEESPSP